MSWIGFVAIAAGAAVALGRAFRWQFLLRFLGMRLALRPVVRAAVVSAGLGVLTPVHLGELARVLMVPGRANSRGPLLFTAGADLAWDVQALGVVAAVGGLHQGAAVFAVGVVAWALLAWAGRRSRTSPRRWIACWAWGAGFSVVAWVLLASLAGLAAGQEIGSLVRTWFPWAAARQGFEAPGFGVPALQVPWPESAPLLGFLTVGLAAAAPGLRQLGGRRAASPPHFDDIAAEYLAQWSPHVWELLLRRRMAFLNQALGLPGPAGVGLDLGCGLGLQAAHLRETGYRVLGLDPAGRLLRGALERSVPAVQGNALALPFRNGSLDFVYTIGVLHHLDGPGDQALAVGEIARVLKPGGMLLVQETNPRNPLFRFHMGYTFPLLKVIDEGTEWWIPPEWWPRDRGLKLRSVRYFTFLPDFTPRFLLPTLRKLESRLEAGPFRRLSAHYMVVLEREPA